MKNLLLLALLVLISCGGPEKESPSKKPFNNPERLARFHFVTDSLIEATNFSALNKLMKEAIKAKIDSTIVESVRAKAIFKNDSILDVKRKALAKLKRNLDFKYDEFKEFTWVSTKNSNKGYGNKVYSYFGFGKDSLVQNPRIVFRYYGSDWIFWDKATLLIDGTPHNYTPSSRPDRDNGGGSVWETSDSPASTADLSWIASLKTAKEAKYRLTGDYYKDFKFSKRDIDNLVQPMEYYLMKKYLKDNIYAVTF